jgi:hypothetical protein
MPLERSRRRMRGCCDGVKRNGVVVKIAIWGNWNIWLVKNYASWARISVMDHRSTWRDRRIYGKGWSDALRGIPWKLHLKRIKINPKKRERREVYINRIKSEGKIIEQLSWRRNKISVSPRNRNWHWNTRITNFRYKNIHLFSWDFGLKNKQKAIKLGNRLK